MGGILVGSKSQGAMWRERVEVQPLPWAASYVSLERQVKGKSHQNSSKETWQVVATSTAALPNK